MRALTWSADVLPPRPLPVPALFRLAAVPLALALGGCGDPAGPPPPEAGNVDSRIGALVEETDTGVVVNGEWRLQHPSREAALRVDRYLHYELGGFPELDYAQDERWSDSWRVSLTHETARIERNDSVIHTFADHGAAAVEGEPMTRLTEIHVRDGAPVRFEGFVSYLRTTMMTVAWTGGGESTVLEDAYHPRLLAGDAITVATTGSEGVDPVTATFSAIPTSTLTGLENGEPLDLDVDTPPVVSAIESLALTFDRAVDADHVFFALAPFTDAASGARAAFLQTRSATTRAVIPASVLRDLVRDAATATVPYILVVKEARWQPDVFAGSFTGGDTFSLPLIESSETTVLLYLTR